MSKPQNGPADGNAGDDVAAHVPALLTLDDMLTRLGCGRTYLLAHLRAHPVHAGQPTHRRIGRRIMFTPADFNNLLETFAPKPLHTVSAPSALNPHGAFERAMALATAGLKRNKAKRR